MVHHDTYTCIYHEYLERLTRTGPRRLHVLFKYILSKFSAYNMNAHAHTQTRTRTHKHTHTHQSQIRAIRTMSLKTRFSKRGFQGRFKRADRGRMADRNRELVPDNWSLVRERAFVLLAVDMFTTVFSP